MLRAIKLKRSFSHKNSIKIFIIIILTVSLFISVIYEVRARPVIREVASSQAENMAQNAIEDAIVRVLKEHGVTYSSLVKIEKDSMGKVTSIEADIVKMNLLKSEISSAISEEILLMDSDEVSIPIGTIIGTSFLSGKGPKITTTVTLSSNVNSSIDNLFTSAGINQTLHEIVININAIIYIIMPRNRVSTEINTNFCIAQTVIIGVVPETFAEFQNKGEIQ